MKKYFAIFCLAALALAGCNREEFAPSETPSLTGKTVLTLSIPETKTTMGELSEGKRPVYWANGDKVAVNGVVSEPLEELPANSRSAEFIVNGVLSAPFCAVYPETLWKDENTVTLPQNAKSGVLPLAGYGDMATMSVKPLTAAVKLSIKKYSGENPDLDKIVQIWVASEDTKLSGDFAIDFETGALTPGIFASGDNQVGIRPNLTLTDEAKEVFIPVPAGTYNFKVRLVDIQGHFMEVSTTSAKTFAAGEIKAFPEIEFVPTGTAIDVVITSAEDLIQFAEDWNDGQWESVIVKVANDFSFDAESSAAYSATGGIGTEDNYFNGTFDGNSKTIGGYTGSVPIFAYTGGNGIVKDLTLDSTCSFAPPSGVSGYFGILVDRHKGLMQNCVSEANLTINNLKSGASAEEDITDSYGGLVGRVAGGKIDGCEMKGNILCPQAGSFSNLTVYIGGIAGTVYNEGASIVNSSFSGSIKVSNGNFSNEADNTDYGGISFLGYMEVGGIAGNVAKNTTIKDCTTKSGVEIDLRGKFKTYIGGIAGLVSSENTEVSGCENNASVYFVSNGARADTSPCYIGGIVGIGCKDLTGCTNYGALASYCYSTTHYIGGIAGLSGADVTDCTNETTGTITRKAHTATSVQGNRYMAFGGITGHINGNAVYKGDVNKAPVLSEQLYAHNNVTIRMGGIVGGSEDYTVSFENCSNSGAIEHQDATGSKTYMSALGGILGATKVAVSFKNCTNTGSVKNNFTTKANNRPGYVGGIVGLIGNYTIKEGDITDIAGVKDVSILLCSNTGRIENHDFNNILTLMDGVFAGGICGALVSDSESRAKITSCTVSKASSTSIAYNYRGIVGGIAGYVSDTDVDKCTVGQFNMGGNASGDTNAGLIGVMKASTLTDSEFASTTLSAVKNSCGLAGDIDGTSVISGCKATGVTINAATKNAVFVLTAASGATITDCGASGTIGGAAISTESTFVLNDGGATISGTYIIS